MNSTGDVIKERDGVVTLDEFVMKRFKYYFLL